MNRTQGVVLGFFALVWVSRVVILVVAPEVYDQALRLSGAEVPSSPFWRRSPGLSVACRRRDAVLALDVLVDPGRLAVRRASGGRGRVAAHRVLAVDTPVWYVLYQGLLGVAQFGIALAMMVGYRRAGLWGAN